jgi:cell division septation protein DedD
MGVHQAKMPGYTESKPPEAFMDTRNALFPDDAGRDDPNIIQPAYSYPDVPAPKGCRRRKRIRPLPDNAKPMRLPSRIATQLDKEEAEAAQREMQMDEASEEEALEEEALDPEQSKESSIRTKQRKRKSGNRGARNQRRLAKKRQWENNSTVEVGETVEENCNVYK